MKRLALVFALIALPALAQAAPRNGLPMQCNANSLTEREKGRRETLVEELMPEAEVEETDAGFQFTWKNDPTAYGKVTEFVGIERRCCAFLDFELHVAGPNDPVVLILTGDDDTKKWVKQSGLLQGKP
jgi:hypothetical protein